MKHLLFEENGDFRAGTTLSEAGNSLQVELASGKRTKVKGSHVLLRYDAPSPDALLTEARELAGQIDLDFLWECAPQDEFDFQELAADYFGGQPGPVQSTALLLRLHGAPVYFHRKGRGRYRPAAPETLRLALAALERRRIEEERVEADATQMAQGVLPPDIAGQAVRLLVRPDRNGLAWKAFDRALTRTGRSPERLLLELGAFPSAYALHVSRFVAEHFPHGTGFDLPADSLDGVADRLQALPVADVRAFSVDDSSTTEIDDAFSVRRIEGGWRVGVHIAAPALAITAGSAADAVARERMSTVYMPGDKITMLPDALVSVFSLDEGGVMPAVSLYVDTNEDASSIVGQYSQVERVPVVANLRHDRMAGVYSEALLSQPVADGENGPVAVDAPTDGGGAAGPDGADVPFLQAMRVLWRLTLTLSAERDRVRGRPEGRFRAEYTFYLDPASSVGGVLPAADTAAAEPEVRIVPRRRDEPLDRIVAEMAILANSEWGRLLAEHDLPGIYRSQQNGRVKVTSHPMPHQGLGVPQYMWSTSPLRRYVDLLNQRQLVAALGGEEPALRHNDAELFQVMAAFDGRYAAYGDFQQRMERYWCIRWAQQQGLSRVEAVVIREDLVRIVAAPLYVRVPRMPLLPPGQVVTLELMRLDALDLSVEARFLAVAAAGTAIDVAVDEDPDLLAQAVEVEAPAEGQAAPAQAAEGQATAVAQASAEGDATQGMTAHSSSEPS